MATTAREWQALKRPQLIALCKKHGIKAKGTNSELVTMLQKVVDSNGGAWDAMDMSHDRSESQDEEDEEMEDSTKPLPKLPASPVVSIADLMALQRTSEERVLHLHSPRPSSGPMTLSAAPSPFRPQPASSGSVRPTAVHTSPVTGRRISNLPARATALTSPMLDPSQARFVFGTPEPHQTAVVCHIGGSMWKDLPVPEEEHDAEAENKEEVPEKAVDAVWAELNARTGAGAREKPSLSQAADESRPSLEGKRPESPTRFGKAHDKVFGQVRPRPSGSLLRR